MSHKWTLRTISFIIFGTIITVIGLIHYFFLKDILRIYNKRLLQISPSMKFYQEWKDTPTHILNRMYFFNFTNSDDFEKNGTKPILKEVGPYTFKEYQNKTNITWNSNSTVSYRVHRVWYFQPDMSNGTLVDNITTISFLPLGTEHFFKDQSNFIQRGASMALTGAGETLAITKTVNEFAFKGYEYIYSLIGSYLYPTLKKIGFFHMFNDSSLRDGVLNVDTGEFDVKQNGKVKSWNYSPYKYYGGLITGTTAEFFSSELQKTNITIFTPWLCRDMYLYYAGEEYVHGIKGYKFVGTERNIDNGTKYKENLASGPGKRYPSGIIDVSQCYYDNQIVFSYPHFFMADPYFASKVEGMKPDPGIHDAYCIVEPISGVPLKGKLSGQANFIVNQNKNYRLYKNVPPYTVIPVFWMEKSFEIPNNKIIRFMKTYLYTVQILEMTAIPLVIIGIFIILLVILWHISPRFRMSRCYRFTLFRRGTSSTDHSRSLEMNKKYHFTKLPQSSLVTKENIKINTPE